MASYPAFPQIVGSVLQPLDDLRLDEAVDGSVRGRSFYPVVTYRLTLMHKLSVADLATFKQFYVDNRLADSVSVQWKPECPDAAFLFDCLFEGVPVYEDDNPYTTVTVRLRTVTV